MTASSAAGQRGTGARALPRATIALCLRRIEVD
jgi:hypothetical protein